MESGLIILINRGDTATSARPGQTNRGRQIKHSAPRAAANYAHRARTEQLSPVSTRGAATCFESAARGIKLHKYSGNHVMMERCSARLMEKLIKYLLGAGSCPRRAPPKPSNCLSDGSRVPLVSGPGHRYAAAAGCWLGKYLPRLKFLQQT